MQRLTQKQKKFCDYYIKTGVGAEAARLAGYKKSNCDNMAVENLRKPMLREYIEKQIEKLDSERIATMKEVSEFITGIIRDEKVEMKDRLKATDMFIKTRGGYLERVEHSGKIDIKKDFSKMTDEELELLANGHKES